MPLEREVMGLLIGGFVIVMGIVIITTLLLWFKNKHKSYVYTWILLHLLLFSVAVYFLLEAISFNNNHLMASEEISLRIGIAGVIWAISMLCLLIGVYKFSKN